MVGAIALAPVIASIVLVVGRNHLGGPTTGPAHPFTGPRTVPATPSHTNQPANTNLSYTPVQALGVAGNGVAWTANGVGLYLTADGGVTWSNITPPIFTGQDVSTRIDAMVGIGTQDLWLPVVDVIALFPPTAGAASDRFNGVEHSTDGGKTWTFTALPGCLQSCEADISLSFPDAEHGFALEGGLNGQAMFFSTDDGGTTWTQLGGFPALGGLAIGGTQMAFSNLLDGWAVTGSTPGTDGQVTSPGGVLYRSIDGGSTWSIAPGLPSNEAYQLPVLFGDQDAVVIGRPVGGASTHQPVIYTTVDGGVTWTSHPTPVDKAIASWPSDGAPIPFAATGPTDWALFVGPRLYTTTNAGSTWAASIPKPTWSPKGVYSMVFTSPKAGWLQALKPAGRVQSSSTGEPGLESYSVLMATADGGRTWTPQNP
jgi:photosystem II stability/assembly factor-like uncharacterized protein